MREFTKALEKPRTNSSNTDLNARIQPHLISVDELSPKPSSPSTSSRISRHDGQRKSDRQAGNKQALEAYQAHSKDTGERRDADRYSFRPSRYRAQELKSDRLPPTNRSRLLNPDYCSDDT
ncbi:hypothetical protein VTL71DRAFT_11218, partial [Oculimacula yallundae]